MLTYQIGRGVLSRGSHPALVRGPGTDPTLERPLGDAAASAAGDTDAGRVYFVVAAFHRSDGRRLWEYQLEADEQLPAVHRKANLASASSVTDGSLVYALFGTGQLVALDMNGQFVWERHLGRSIRSFSWCGDMRARRRSTRISCSCSATMSRPRICWRWTNVRVKDSGKSIGAGTWVPTVRHSSSRVRRAMR